MKGIDAVVEPEGSLEVLSQREVNELCDSGRGGLYEQFRRCCLAVLNCGSAADDTRAVLAAHQDFSVRLVPAERGVKIELRNAPRSAFVDGKMIRGIREHLFAVLRDILYVRNEIERSGRFDLASSGGLTDAVFNVLRNARLLRPRSDSRLVVCWGGHSVSRAEYDYSKRVGYELGLRGLQVCTGCGQGAMKGPMKGATIGHAKQRLRHGRYIGISEPGIIAAESPNPIVNELVIMPDMEKRLEAFVRLGHGFVVFPGGVGTCEELFYLLGVLLHPDNEGLPLPLVLTGPEAAREYFEGLLAFVRATLGEGAARGLRVVIGDPEEVARRLARGIEEVFAHRRQRDDAYYFNWLVRVDPELQRRFVANHDQMARLALHRDQPPHLLAAHLRRAFSGIVSGNVKEEGMRLVEAHGPFELRGDPSVLEPLEGLLGGFVAEGRMRLPGVAYEPCYRLVA